MPRTVLWMFPFVPALVAPAAHSAGDAVRGESLYEARCGGCHALDENRIGPRHQGVVGRKAGSLGDFDYSPALKKSGLVWTPARLDQWLTNPEKLVPGQRMGYRLNDAGERADVIAFLQTKSAR